MHSIGGSRCSIQAERRRILYYVHDGLAKLFRGVLNRFLKNTGSSMKDKDNEFIPSVSPNSACRRVFEEEEEDLIFPQQGAGGSPRVVWTNYVQG